MYRPALIAALLAALPAVAAATPAQTQAEMNAAAAARAATADRALNAVYNRAVARATPDGAGLLRQAQRRWIAFRDAECAFRASGVSGGSVQPMVHADCIRRITAERTEQLAELLRCREGDLACPL